MKFILFIYLLFSAVESQAQTQDNLVGLIYIKERYSNTKNQSFLKKELLFLKGSDTLILNVRVPFNYKKKEIIGTNFYGCHLIKDTVYSIGIKKIKPSEIPIEYNSYYHTNGIFSYTDNPAKFIETEKNTIFKYVTYHDQYIDIDNTLYQVVNIYPPTDCVLQH